uniref:Single domain-containing protein n=1 Tax=Amblyomma cajennense TaxID=34607 RepID=A0A023FQU4_AMBCJ
MSKVTQLLLLTIALTEHIALCEKKKNVSSLEFVKDTCRFHGHTIKDGDYEYPKGICEEWKCNVTARRLTVAGCYIPDRHSSCIHVTDDRIYWPRCCHFYRYYC